MDKNMRIHEDHEAVLAYGGKYLFCSDFAFTKQILNRTFGRFCLILPHNPHTLRIVNKAVGSGTHSKPKNMRIMRIAHEGLFNGFYLPCIEMGVRSRPKHEAGMRIHEADPHVLTHRQGASMNIPYYFLKLLLTHLREFWNQADYFLMGERRKSFIQMIRKFKKGRLK
jgi:hypothetical protein